MWRTTFAFQTWHSAVELKRHFLAFVQEFDRIHTLSGVRRGRYNPYDSVVRPSRSGSPPGACAPTSASPSPTPTSPGPPPAASPACT